MKIRTHRLAWAVSLFAGVPLLNNHKVFREFGDGIWVGCSLWSASVFLIWSSSIGSARRAIAGFPSLTIGILLLLTWRGIDLGVWQAALVLFGAGTRLLDSAPSGDDNWWALIPAGCSR
jgi:hypothetical protein